MVSSFNMASSTRGIQIGNAWFQRKINLRPQHRGVHLVTEEILRQIPELCQFSIGMCHFQSELISLFYALISFKLVSSVYINKVFILFISLLCCSFAHFRELGAKRKLGSRC